MMPETIIEPARHIPIIHDVDVCVLGGGCTGVFAAVRAARLGASVVIVEKQNAFGGVATSGLVNVWHSVYDTKGKQVIIGGLTQEVVERLLTRDAATPWQADNPSAGTRFNSEELKIELDQLIEEHGITPMLHTIFCAAQVACGAIRAVFVENKNGRGAIRAKVFIDATGDGDLACQAGLPYSVDAHMQPPTTCAKIAGLNGVRHRTLYNTHREEFGLQEDSGWNGDIPHTAVRMYAETHAFGRNCADADQLTKAEMEERKHIRGLMDIVRKYASEQRDELCLLALASYIGIRETRRFTAEYCLTETDVLEGVRFPDAIANGSYRVDLHNPSGGGFVLKYLSGAQVEYTSIGVTHGRWREPRDVDPTFYQIPYRTMVHRSVDNLIMAGRMIAADKAAYGAIRVMVNLNQTGEAAGVAAVLALRERCPAVAVSPVQLRETLAEGGSIIL